MHTQYLKLTFLTPAFLGDAEQNARWRTPPIKHLLREWWRVIYAADHGFTPIIADMRREEGLLFGNAWLSHKMGNREVTDHRKSLVRIRLERWEEGQLKKTQWPADTTIRHPEVSKPIGSSLYLGYGPLTFKNSTALKANAAIQSGESATLSIAVPDEYAQQIQRILWLMDRYGTVGGRSRNGWGSFALLPLPPGEGWGEGQTPPLRLWRDCLNLDWPHAIGKDEKGPLIWQTTPHGDWKALMKTLAILKIGLRTQFMFTSGNNAPHPEARHWLSYPVTKHSVAAWGNNARLPNQLRFKVRRTDDGKLVGVIFHVPHLPPAAFRPDRPAIEQVWRQVHVFLDATAQKLTRIPE